MKEKDQTAVDDLKLKMIADMIKNIRYGSITVIVQDGKVVQIDKTEKVRIKS